MRGSVFILLILSSLLVSCAPGMKELTGMILDPSDADRRREGIVALSQHPRGLDEQPCKLYANVAANPREDVNVRAAAVDALGRSGRTEHCGGVAALLEDPSDLLRWRAAVALDTLPGEAAIEPLRKHALSDRLLDVRVAATQALRHYRRQDVAYTLLGCLNDRDFSIRFKAHGSLVQVTGQDLGYRPGDWRDLLDTLPPSPPDEEGEAAKGET